MSNKRKINDLILQGITYAASFFSLFVLLTIIGFVFVRGVRLLNLDLITESFSSVSYIASIDDNQGPSNYVIDKEFKEGVYYSTKWGIALRADMDLSGSEIIVVEYVHPDSIFLNLNNEGIAEEKLVLRGDYKIVRIAFYDAPSVLSIQGAENMIRALDENDDFRVLEFSTKGGGIKGSIVTTLVLILLTLLFALPIGIGSAIYLNEYAPKNRLTNLIRSFIETLTGVPSVIYGLMGLAIFVPLTMKLTSSTGGNLIAGAMTLSVILLPIIIRTTEESLKVVPDDYRHASLALGASRTQTTFKVVLPNAISGILTATLLAIGRIIGESAALVIAVGTVIRDDISLTGQSTSLAVHIWSIMTDEPANVELATTIAIIILIMVLSLNLSIKLLSRNMIRKYGVKA